MAKTWYTILRVAMPPIYLLSLCLYVAMRSEGPAVCECPISVACAAERGATDACVFMTGGSAGIIFATRCDLGVWMVIEWSREVFSLSLSRLHPKRGGTGSFS